MTLLENQPNAERKSESSCEGPCPSDFLLPNKVSFSSSSTAEKTPLPRFNLKKRPISLTKTSKEPTENLLATVNSAFLSGLFADVAKVQVSQPQPSSQGESNEEDPRADSSSPVKKMRLSKTKSMTRCGKSFKTLSEAETGSLLASPQGAADFFGAVPETTSASMERHDSLQYQLTCVSAASSSDVSCSAATLGYPAVVDAGKLAFPHLPSSVGTSSCKLTRKISDLQTFDTDNNSNKQQESYGWFVVMDNDEFEHPTARSATAMQNSYSPYGATAAATPSAATTNLAFLAATAPKAVSYDAEVEWAKAADTVDDVLGDFF